MPTSASCAAETSSAASVMTTQSMVAMRGPIMAAPLAMPVITTSRPPIQRVRLATLCRVSVVSMPRAAASSAASSCASASLAMSHASRDFVERQKLADDASRQDEDLVGLGTNRFGEIGGHGCRVAIAPRAGTRIGIARVDDDAPNLAAGSPLAVVTDRRGENFVLRVHTGRDGWPIGNDQRQVLPGRTALDAAVYAGEPKTARNAQRHKRLSVLVPMRFSPNIRRGKHSNSSRCRLPGAG